MGYHIASEYLADREHQIKDEEAWFKHDEGHRHNIDHFRPPPRARHSAVRFRPDDLTEKDMLSLATEGLRLYRGNWTEIYTVVLEEIQSSLRTAKKKAA